MLRIIGNTVLLTCQTAVWRHRRQMNNVNHLSVLRFLSIVLLPLRDIFIYSATKDSYSTQYKGLARPTKDDGDDSCFKHHVCVDCSL